MPRKVVGAKVVDGGGEGEGCTPVQTHSPEETKLSHRPRYDLWPTALRLRELMGEFGWKATDVAALMRRSVSQVYFWRGGSRKVPDHMIELLEYKADEIRRKSALKETT